MSHEDHYEILRIVGEREEQRTRAEKAEAELAIVRQALADHGAGTLFGTQLTRAVAERDALKEKIDVAFNTGFNAAREAVKRWHLSVTVDEPLHVYLDRLMLPTPPNYDAIGVELAEKDKALRFAVGLLANTDAADGKYPQELYDWLIRAAQDAIAEQKERDAP